MRRRDPEEEACGVWLDAAALKRRKVQTQLIKSSTKMLTLFPGERKAKISFPQRTPPAGVRQTSIVSFFTLQPGLGKFLLAGPKGGRKGFFPEEEMASWI
ncbi:aurora kinase A and ninein-interacting protein isoform X2 [Rhinolophus ferrumequinum]|uniref:aurora kinase A and ninein-interacting protein isoform X2 n=1 Tax=Rhinolophus ferrumequinum TaxID=59479 RepID=UPI00140F96BB|nr:aurora kinase A and ninein-interacting protein isoform X2 [Rhinolophus ferrumequinum]